jgi:hypothetical protein
MPAKKQPTGNKPGRKTKGPMRRQDLAAMAGVSIRSLAVWEEKEGLDLNDTEAVMVRAQKTHERATANEDEKEAKLRKTKAEADMIEHKLAIQRGEFVPAYEMDKDGVQIGMAVAAVFSRMADDLAPLCAGRTAGEIKKLVTKYAREKRTELSQYESRVEIPTE